MFTPKIYLLVVYVFAVLQLIPYQLCDARPSVLSLQVEPAKVEQIDFTSLKADQLPLVPEVADPNQYTEIERQDFSFEENPELYQDDMDEVYESPEEMMDTANALVFRPLFAYRNKKLSRRSSNQGGIRGNRRSQQSVGAVVKNQFGNKSPSYLVYDRKSGAYYPYYFPKRSYSEIRRS